MQEELRQIEENVFACKTTVSKRQRQYLQVERDWREQNCRLLPHPKFTKKRAKSSVTFHKLSKNELAKQEDNSWSQKGPRFVIELSCRPIEETPVSEKIGR